MSDGNPIQTAIAVDLEGLTALSAALPNMQPDLDQALALLMGMTGRLIVTGLGKSGHIGAKLAATFTSTGTPAYFLHPSEASHGDLGMVQSGDVILALSWSGETHELSDIIGYSKRHSIPLIAITGNATGTLAQSASVALTLPKVREACPHNLAPTTSTLLQLTLGDAMAVALLQMKGFTEESFHGFHPGGSLGAALKRVEEIMHAKDVLPLVAEDRPVIEAISELSARGHGIVGVLAPDGMLGGVITDGDIRRYLESQAGSTMREALHETQSGTIMTKGAVSVGPDMLVGECLSILQTRRISAAFVLEEGHPAGLITVLRMLNRGVV